MPIIAAPAPGNSNTGHVPGTLSAFGTGQPSPAACGGSDASKKLHFSVSSSGNQIYDFSCEIFPGTSSAELMNLLQCSLEAEGISVNENTLRLMRRDGTVLPLSSSLPGNSKADSYLIPINQSQIPAAVLNRAQEQPAISTARRTSTASASVPGSASVPRPVEVTEISPTMQSISALSKIEEFARKISLIPDFTTTLRQLQDIGRHFDAIEGFYSALEKKYPDLQCGISPISKFVRKSARVDAAILSEAAMTISDDLRQQLKQPIFNNWRWAENQMTAMIESMFHEWGLVKRFDLDLVTLRRFLMTVKENYNPNPFHNFRHAFCVTQMFYGLVCETGIQKKLKELDLLVGLIACVCHDVDHPGFNNAYQINARTDLAILYNDQSPLENHHCSLAFSVLKLPDCNVLKSLDRKDYEYVRKGIIRCILATDMSRHAEIMAKFNSFGDKFTYEDQDHKDTLIVMLVKCSDISNEARPPNVSEPWLDCLLEEYFMQSDREKMEGLPVAPFMDRDKVTKPSAQIGFIEFVMMPMFNSIARVLPQLKSTVVNQINKSLIYYKALMEEQKLQQQQQQQQLQAPSSRQQGQRGSISVQHGTSPNQSPNTHKEPSAAQQQQPQPPQAQQQQQQQNQPQQQPPQQPSGPTTKN